MKASVRRICLALLLVIGHGACRSPTEAERAELDVQYYGSTGWPVGLLRLFDGLSGELIVDGRVAEPGIGGRQLGPFPLPSSPEWSFVVSLVSEAGDTIALARSSLPVPPGHVVQIGALALPNLELWRICSLILARIPISSNAVVPDTFYVTASGRPKDEQPPPC